MSKQSQWRDKYKRLHVNIDKYIDDTGFWVRLKNYQTMLKDMQSVNTEDLPPQMQSGPLKELRERGILTMNALVNNYIKQAHFFKLTSEELGYRFKMDSVAVQNEIDKMINEANIILAGYEKITKHSETLLGITDENTTTQEQNTPPKNDTEENDFQKVFSRPNKQ